MRKLFVAAAVLSLLWLSASAQIVQQSLGSAAFLNVGTAANNVVQLDGSARLPAVSGALLTSLPGAISTKVIALTRDTSAASGNVSYTGCGFQPTALVLVGSNNVTTSWSVGVVDSARGAGNIFMYFAATTSYSTAALRVDAPDVGGAHNQSAAVASYDPDGFTLTWTKTGTPTGTAGIYALCMK